MIPKGLRKHISVITKRRCALVGGLVAYGCGVFLLGVLCGPSIRNNVKERLGTHRDEVVLTNQKVHEILDLTLGIIQKRGGLIPSDPYKALLECNNVESVDDLMVYNGGIPMFHAAPLPVRISTNIQDNAEYVLFFANGPDGRIWAAFANGRVRVLEPYDRNGESFGVIMSSHAKLFEAAGYPRWATKADRDVWISQKASTLRWDARRHLYVVQH